jgi:hypothetical protein
MSSYLVVAHRTLVEDHLIDHVRTLCATESPVRLHLVVPVTHPRDHAWTDGEVEAAARRRLDEGTAAFEGLGAQVTGEVGDANPVYAVATALRASQAATQGAKGAKATKGAKGADGADGAEGAESAEATPWDGIIVSTLPPGISRWLGLDAVSRIRREFDLPVTHLVAARAAAET